VGGGGGVGAPCESLKKRLAADVAADGTNWKMRLRLKKAVPSGSLARENDWKMGWPGKKALPSDSLARDSHPTMRL